MAADDQPSVDAAAVEEEGQGLPVAESGRLIGLSGQELDPVVGPGQVAPGMDEATYRAAARVEDELPGLAEPAGSRKGQAAGKQRSGAGREADAAGQGRRPRRPAASESPPPRRRENGGT